MSITNQSRHPQAYALVFRHFSMAGEIFTFRDNRIVRPIDGAEKVHYHGLLL
jgi:hypothetical protein